MSLNLPPATGPSVAAVHPQRTQSPEANAGRAVNRGAPSSADTLEKAPPAPHQRQAAPSVARDLAAGASDALTFWASGELIIVAGRAVAATVLGIVAALSS